MNIATVKTKTVSFLREHKNAVTVILLVTIAVAAYMAWRNRMKIKETIATGFNKLSTKIDPVLAKLA